MNIKTRWSLFNYWRKKNLFVTPKEHKHLMRQCLARLDEMYLQYQGSDRDLRARISSSFDRNAELSHSIVKLREELDSLRGTYKTAHDREGVTFTITVPRFLARRRVDGSLDPQITQSIERKVRRGLMFAADGDWSKY